MTRAFTIPGDGDEHEKRWWPQWTREYFPSYEAFWAARVVRLEIVGADAREPDPVITVASGRSWMAPVLIVKDCLSVLKCSNGRWEYVMFDTDAPGWDHLLLALAAGEADQRGRLYLCGGATTIW